MRTTHRRYRHVATIAIVALSTSIVAACTDGDDTKRAATTTTDSATTQAVSDTTVAVSDTTAAVSDTTATLTDTPAAGADTTVVVSAVTAQLQTVVEEAVAGRRASPDLHSTSRRPVNIST